MTSMQSRENGETYMSKTVLMVAFDLPPSAISSGYLRPLAFAKYLPSFGWAPVALSANERAYTRTDPASVGMIPDHCLVYRAFAIDARRQLGVGGRYPSILAQPDRWSSWWPAAVYQGLRLIRRHRVQAIWSTYPIMTAHCVAHTLSCLTGVPWVADFRDPVATSVAAQDPRTISTQMRWEHRVLNRAAYSVFTTPGARQSCAERYPEIDSAKRLKVIPNGFDEDDFTTLPPYVPFKNGRPIHLVHGGLLYPSGRNPLPFFEALASLTKSGHLTARDIKVTLRASGSEARYATDVDRLGLTGMVTLAPALPYREGLAEQSQADALLLFQGDQFDNQIPTKLYEYLRVGRPIFALVGSQGETAAVLRQAGCAAIVSGTNADIIQTALLDFVHAFRQTRLQKADSSKVLKYSRLGATAVLAKTLDEATAEADQ